MVAIMGTEDYLPGRTQFNFGEAPPEGDSPCRFELVRTPPKGFFRATVISENVVGHRMHHWHGSTLPCVDRPCEACEARRKSEWKGWVFVVDESRMDPFVFEFPTSGGFAFKKIREKYTTIRGLRIETYRKTKRGNGPIGINLGHERADIYKLPLAPSMLKFLAALWRMEVSSFSGSGIDALGGFSEAEAAVHLWANHPMGKRVSASEPMTLAEVIAARDIFTAAQLPVVNGVEVKK